jgi:hypothetical protein
MSADPRLNFLFTRGAWLGGFFSTIAAMMSPNVTAT